MTNNAVAEAAWTVETKSQFTREAVLRVLDTAPDGYKLLARLVDDPCDLVRDYDPRSGGRASAQGVCGRSRGAKLQERLRIWLIAGLQQESRQAI